ncbi:hypothetical protein [Sciscionella marina]|uniref:hypothetical protein n=1 Tax=Sciscionella marina TaxID=508770 RepID=UPI0003A6A994|nr:hypothetical protein [Sciscionella marina]
MSITETCVEQVLLMGRGDPTDGRRRVPELTSQGRRSATKRHSPNADSEEEPLDPLAPTDRATVPRTLLEAADTHHWSVSQRTWNPAGS